MTKAADDTGRGKGSARWRIQDLMDLEYFFFSDTNTEADDDAPSSAPTARDIYLTRLEHLNDGRPESRRLLIKNWLAVRHESEDGPTPGAIYKEINRICLVVAALLGILSGIGLAMSLLDYSGTQPLNVSVYLGVGVFTQILLLFLLAAIFSFRAASRSLVRNSILARLLGRMLAGAFIKARQRALKEVDGRKREALAAATGLLRGRKQIYGSLFFWPVFIVVQVFALCFNTGLLSATLIKLTGTDVAFGWQSTFQVGSNAVFQIARTMALPWRELLPSALAYPSLEQIEGSRIILKEGIYHLATRNLVSWWPFLCLSVFCYGLLPRLILLTSGAFVQRRLLARLRFDHRDCDCLVRRMTTPVLRTAGTSQPASDPQGPISDEAKSTPWTTVPGNAGDNYAALVPEDIFDVCEGLEDVAARELGMQVTDLKKIGAGFVQYQAVLDSLKARREDAGPGGVLVLQEAWQPPIRETLQFLIKLRQRLGNTGRVVVGLIGKPDSETIFTTVRDGDWRIWKRKIEALGDPYLRVERLLPHDQ